jgi:hypothetical protein
MIDTIDIYHLETATAMFAGLIGVLSAERLDGAPPHRLIWGIANVIEL